MEAVRAFNNELSSLYEVRPPISKAKMTQITKCAIKGIKFYKHIVQSVEKFIQKCRPEYKVPGLYVVDSIVRQSRHQFGADKDVFAPRFTKNITLTFQNLFKCAEEDRPKIVRVLNLWQKNNVFPSDVVQPLMDMANPNTSDWSFEVQHLRSNESPIHKSFQQAVSNENILPQNAKHKTADLSSWKGWSQPSQVNEESLPDSRSYVEMSSGNLEKFTKGDNSNAPVREDILAHLPQISSQLNVSKTEVKPLEENTVKFNKKLLDFDYGDEEDEEEKPDDGQLSNEPNALALSMAQNLLSNPELLRQLQQMQQTIQQNEALKSELALQDQDESSMHEEPDDEYSPEPHNSPTAVKILPFPEPHQQDVQYQFDNSAIPFPPQQPPPPIIETLPCEPSVYQQPILPQEQLILQNSQVDEDERIMHSMPGEPPLPPRDLDERPQVVTTTDERNIQAIPFPEPQNLLQYQFDNNAIPFPPPQQPPPVRDAVPLESTYQQPVLSQDQLILQTSQIDEDERIMYSMPGEPPLPPHDLDERPLTVATEERVKKERSRSRSRSRTRTSRHRSRSKSPRRRKSRSRSGSRSRSRRRDRSRSRDRERERERERQREKEREREREREKERERRRKGIPSIKKNCMSVCSTTLWLGHVPKTLSESEISSTFGEYGSVSSIDMIPPRGCAYVCMDRRQDAFRALQKLKNLKLQGSTIKMAWAPGKGMKGKEYKEYWEVDLGVSYIPYEKIPDDLDELDFLEEGGSIDEDSMPEHLRELRQQREKERLATIEAIKPKENEANDNSSLKEGIPATGTMLPSSLLPPTSLGIPMVLPQMMQPQFGMHLPGLMPHQAMVMQVPMGVPPPNPLMMVQPPSQTILGGQPLPVVGTVPQMPPMPISIPTALPVSSANTVLTASSDSTTDSTAVSSAAGLPISSAGDATPTDEDGTSVSTPAVTSTVQTLSVAATAISLQSSLPQTGTQQTGSLVQFSSLLGLHGTGRPLMTVPPPVSTAGAPIPFPPPHVGFGFPPPPIRPPPGQAQGLPTVASLPNSASFSWLPKSSTPGFGNFADSELRYGSTVTSTVAGNVRPVAPPIQQSGLPPHMFGVRHPMFTEPPPSDQPTSVAGSQPANSNSSDIQSRLSGSAAQKNKDGSLTQSSGIEGDVFGSHISHDSTTAHGGPNANHSPMKGFVQHGGVSPRSQQESACGDTSLEEQDEPPHDSFAPPNLDMACHLRDDLIMPPNARFPGPMDFHHGRGPMDHLWMRGPPPGVMPGPRFPRGMRPPFPRRMGGPRGMPPRMEMQFPRHQGPRGPRMHMGGPRGPPRRNGPLLQTPPRHSGGREWFSGRREFYDNVPFEREEHDRRYRQKGDWDHEREDWDQAENDKGWEMPDMDWEHRERDEHMQDNAPNNDQEKVEKDGSDKQSEREAKPERPRPPETYMQDDKDWSKDMFRLQFYSRDKENEPRQHERSHSNKNRDRNHHEHESKESRDHGAGHESSDAYDNRNALEHGNTGEHANVHDHGNSRDRGEHGNSREHSERGNSRDRGERGNSREHSERGNSHDRGERGNSRDRGERGNSRDRGEQGNSRDRGERGNSRDRGERGNSRDRGERGNSRDRGDRGEHSNSRDRGEHSNSRDRGEHSNSRDRSEHSNSRDRSEHSTSRDRDESRDRGSARDRDSKSRDRGRDRDTRERKRSRWGRTLSQERELQQQQQQQQQQQNEIEQTFQNNEIQPVLVEQIPSSDDVTVQDVLPIADNLDSTNAEDKEVSNGMDDSTEPVVLAPVVAES